MVKAMNIVDNVCNSNLLACILFRSAIIITMLEIQKLHLYQVQTILLLPATTFPFIYKLASPFRRFLISTTKVLFFHEKGFSFLPSNSLKFYMHSINPSTKQQDTNPIRKS